MKEILFLLLLALVTSAQAQINPGERFLAGNLQVQYSLNKSDTGSSSFNQVESWFVSLSPQMQWVKNKHTVLGASVTAGLNGQRAEGNTVDFYHKGYILGASVFVQKVLPIQSKLFLYVEAGPQLLFSSVLGSNSQSENKIKSSSFNAGVYATPGLAWRAADRWIIDLRFNQLVSFSYIHYNTTTSGPSITMEKITNNAVVLSSTLNSGLLQNIGVGFRYVLKHRLS